MIIHYELFWRKYENKYGANNVHTILNFAIEKQQDCVLVGPFCFDKEQAQ